MGANVTFEESFGNDRYVVNCLTETASLDYGLGNGYLRLPAGCPGRAGPGLRALVGRKRWRTIGFRDERSLVSDFKKLHVWQKAHALSLCVDRVSKAIPGARYASLRSQIFRAATSIPANIAEGRRQESEKEFARFLRYALNSCSELEYHLILAHDTKVILEKDYVALVSQTITVRKMLYSLLKRLATEKPPDKRGMTAASRP